MMDNTEKFVLATALLGLIAFLIWEHRRTVTPIVEVSEPPAYTVAASNPAIGPAYLTYNQPGMMYGPPVQNVMPNASDVTCGGC